MADHVGEGDHQAAVALDQPEPEVAAHRVAGLEAAGGVKAGGLDPSLGLQALLELPRARQVRRQRLGELLLGAPLVLQPHAPIDQRAQHASLERLEQEVEGAAFERTVELLVGLRGRAGDEDDVGGRALAPHLLAQAVAVAVAEADVDQRHLETAVVPEAAERCTTPSADSTS